MTFFDDDYTGPRWRYGLTFRPVGAAQVPANWIINSDRKHDGFRHGTIDYPYELTTAEIEGFELTPVELPPGTFVGEVDCGWRWTPFPRFRVTCRNEGGSWSVYEVYTDGREVQVGIFLTLDAAKECGWAHRRDEE